MRMYQRNCILPQPLGLSVRGLIFDAVTARWHHGEARHPQQRPFMMEGLCTVVPPRPASRITRPPPPPHPPTTIHRHATSSV